MTNLEDRIQAIEDREAIRELTTRYCHAIAGADAATIVDLFCEDGAFITGDRESRGKDALQKFYGGLAKQPPIPFIQNHVIDELSGDTARARCSAEIRMVQEGKSVTTAGWYDDTFRRVDGKWKFDERRFHVFHMVPLDEGWA
jgi:uncharacterized protein (TIGR02246 family)